jgi:membrane associated rhomboid family serine protease
MRLIIANAVMFLLSDSLPRELVGHLVLHPVAIPQQPWTLVTYMFLHGGFWHIFLNMLMLFFFGPRLEVRLGSGGFLGLYFTSGLMAAAVSVVATPQASIIGASGAVYGVMLGYARYWPRDKIYIWAVLPIQARILVALLAAISLGNGILGTPDGIAHFAHLGGFLGGYLFLKLREKKSPAARFKKLAQPVVAASSGSARDLARWNKIDRQSIHPLNRDEVDRVLDKIKTNGLSSLTPDERAFLDRFSSP